MTPFTEREPKPELNTRRTFGGIPTHVCDRTPNPPGWFIVSPSPLCPFCGERLPQSSLDRRAPVEPWHHRVPVPLRSAQ